MVGHSMNHRYTGFSIILLSFLALPAIGGFSESPTIQINYYDFLDPGRWYFIPGGISPPWQMSILNKLSYNESTQHPAKIVLGQNTSWGPSPRLDLGFYPDFILQVNSNPESIESQIVEIPWSATNETIITIRHSYLSISNESLKLFKQPFNEFRLDFLVFWSEFEVLNGEKLLLHWGSPTLPSNPISALFFNLSDGINSIRVTDLALFVVTLLITYKSWTILLKRLEGKR